MIPFWRQLASRMQSRIVNGGSHDGKRVINDLPRTLERRVIFGTVGTKPESQYEYFFFFLENEGERRIVQTDSGKPR